MVRCSIRFVSVYINFQILFIHKFIGHPSFIYLNTIWLFISFMQITLYIIYFLKCHFVSVLYLVVTHFDAFNWFRSIETERMQASIKQHVQKKEPHGASSKFGLCNCSYVFFFSRHTWITFIAILIIFSSLLFRQYIQRTKWTNRYKIWSMVWSYGI